MKKIHLATSIAVCLLSFNINAVETKFYGNQIIVKFKNSGKSRIMNADTMQALSTTAQSKLVFKRTTGGGARVLFLDEASSPQAMEKMVTRLNQRSDIEYAEIDYKRYPAAFPADAPDDPFFTAGEQWYLQNNSADSDRGAINAEAVWPQLTGSGVTIAVVDTGITQHPDLNISGNIIPGYDFIGLDPDGSASTDGDGDATKGRDNDPRDTGDLVTSLDKDDIPTFKNEASCNASLSGRSSWHGTLVSGILGARTDNGMGIAGIAPNATILISRALGKCGGYNSDIMDAARWSAGLAVNGVPANSNPAKIVNLSLGGSGACTTTEQDAINAITAAGTVVVVAAGNDDSDSVSSAPGNCTNTINVGATTRRGGKTTYTNVGEEVDLSAPGGSSSSANGPINTIITTIQNKTIGLVTDNSTAAYATVQGTSFSAPLVSGVIAMMLEKEPLLTPQQIYGTLLANATPFPTGTANTQGGDADRDCTSTSCGTGILNAKMVFDALDSNNIVTRNFPIKESRAAANTDDTAASPPAESTGGGGGGGATSFAYLILISLLGFSKSKTYKIKKPLS